MILSLKGYSMGLGLNLSPIVKVKKMFLYVSLGDTITYKSYLFHEQPNHLGEVGH